MIPDADFALPAALVYPVAFLFGALWGSFLNVCIVRLPEGKSVVWPSSRCPKCETPIRAYDNIPVLSYLLLRGKCRACKAPISARYPVVELLMALLCVALVQRFGLSWKMLAHFILCMGLVVVTFVDVVYWIIPNEVSYGLVLVGLAFCFVPGATVPPLDAAIGLVVGAGGLFAVAWLFRFLRGFDGLGDGDWKLMGGLGAILGWRALPFVIFLAAMQGVLAAAAIYLARRGQPLRPAPLPEEPAPAEGEGAAPADGEPPPDKLAVPFGPFLALAALEVVFFGPALTRAFDALVGAVS